MQDYVLTELWDAEKLAIVSCLPRVGRQAYKSLAFSPDGKLFARGWTEGENHYTQKGAITIWNRETFDQVLVLNAGSDDPDVLQFTNDGKLLICCTGSMSMTNGETIFAKLLVWNVQSGKLVHKFQPYLSGETIFALSADDRWIATRGDDDNCCLWDLQKIRREIGE